MLDRPGRHLRAPELPLGGPRSGVVPVVAHPERYYGCTLDTVRSWRDVGAVIQTDATMLLARGPMTELAKSLLEAGLIDCLASDNHGDRRSLSAARVWPEEMGDDENTPVITHSNASRILADQATIPV